MLTFTLFLMLTVNGGPICERDIYRFPFPAAECERRWKASRDHVEHMRSNQPWECEWIDEATHLRDCWDQLDNARRYFLTSPVSQKYALQRLRDLIGANNYALGIMPDFLPVHRFTER